MNGVVGEHSNAPGDKANDPLGARGPSGGRRMSLTDTACQEVWGRRSSYFCVQVSPSVGLLTAPRECEHLSPTPYHLRWNLLP